MDQIYIEEKYPYRKVAEFADAQYNMQQKGKRVGYADAVAEYEDIISECKRDLTNMANRLAVHEKNVRGTVSEKLEADVVYLFDLHTTDRSTDKTGFIYNLLILIDPHIQP